MFALVRQRSHVLSSRLSSATWASRTATFLDTSPSKLARPVHHVPHAAGQMQGRPAVPHSPALAAGGRERHAAEDGRGGGGGSVPHAAGQTQDRPAVPHGPALAAAGRERHTDEDGRGGGGGDAPLPASQMQDRPEFSHGPALAAGGRERHTDEDGRGGGGGGV